MLLLLSSLLLPFPLSPSPLPKRVLMLLYSERVLRSNKAARHGFRALHIMDGISQHLLRQRLSNDQLRVAQRCLQMKKKKEKKKGMETRGLIEAANEGVFVAWVGFAEEWASRWPAVRGTEVEGRNGRANGKGRRGENSTNLAVCLEVLFESAIGEELEAAFVHATDPHVRVTRHRGVAMPGVSAVAGNQGKSKKAN